MNTTDPVLPTISLRISTAKNINVIIGIWSFLVLILLTYFIIRPPYHQQLSYTVLIGCLLIGGACYALSKFNRQQLALAIITYSIWGIQVVFILFGTIPARHALIGLMVVSIVLSGVFISSRGTSLITGASLLIYLFDGLVLHPYQTVVSTNMGASEEVLLMLDIITIFFTGLITARQSRSIQQTTAQLDVTAASLRQKNETLITQNTALQDSEAQFIKLMNSVGDGVFLIDTNGVVLSSNEEAERTLGYANGNMVGIHGTQVCTDWNTEQVIRQLHEAGIDNTITAYGNHKPLNADPFPVETRLTMFKMGGQKVIVAVARDISDRLEAEKVQQQAVKMNSLGIMAGGIAHDFNNLLVAMLAQTSLAKRHLEPTHKAHKAIGKAVDAANRAKGLTKQLLSYSGADITEPELININTFIADNIELLNVSTGSHVTFQTNLAPDLPRICFDRNQLQQIMINLIINASEAIDKTAAGRIIMSTKYLTVTQDLDAFSYFELEEAPHIEVTVEDNGIGMDAQTIEQIFDPFFSTKETGHGLGLAAVLGMVRSHKGALTVASTLGKGTKFSLLLPIGESH